MGGGSAGDVRSRVCDWELSPVSRYGGSVGRIVWDGLGVWAVIELDGAM